MRTVADLLFEQFGERFVDTGELMLNTVTQQAVPPMGYRKGTVWIINDPTFYSDFRGEDIVREHYEVMLRADALGAVMKPPKIDPYNAPKILVGRLMQNRWDIKMTSMDGLVNLDLESEEGLKVETYLKAVIKSIETEGGYVTYVSLGRPAQEYPIKVNA